MLSKNRRTLLTAIAACLVVAYIFVVVPMTVRAERNDRFHRISITVNDKLNRGFVKEADVRLILDCLYLGFDSLSRKDINTYEIEKALNANNRIENSLCRILNDGTLLVEVTPFEPVARVFDAQGSVYVNSYGKRVPADASYHVDVPVVTTDAVADSTMVQRLLPLLRAIKDNPRANALVSSLRIDNRGDIIIIPNVVGHVINFGDTTLIDNKFERLHVFYRDVMPVRGWDAFDTLSIKWDGRVVATKRDKTIPALINIDSTEIVDETLPDEIMMAELSTN